MNRAGTYIDNLSGEALYRSFCPAPLPPEIVIDDEMLRLLIETNRHIAQLDTASKLIPSAELFITMYVRKEALLSSQIEGTQCTLEDVLDPELDVNVNADVSDVVNYIKATQFAIDRLSVLPICNRLLCETHAILLDGVRGREKNPGEFRRSQNWISSKGCALKDARYIPPNVEDMTRSMGELEKYINCNDAYDPLIRTALIHYQFETIHPFLDGNGRIGRLLILLNLMGFGLLEKPVIYVSYFLKKNQLEYYDRIGEVRRSGNYEQWVRFFLEAVSAAAADSLASINKLSELHKVNLARLPQTTRSRDNVRAVFDYLELHPIVGIKRTAAALGVSYNTVSVQVARLLELGILHETTNAGRNRVFAYSQYLDILREGT